MHQSRKPAGLGKGSVAGWRGAKGHPSAFSLAWLSSKMLLYQGLEKSRVQAGDKGGSYLPPQNRAFIQGVVLE